MQTAKNNIMMVREKENGGTRKDDKEKLDQGQRRERRPQCKAERPTDLFYIDDDSHPANIKILFSLSLSRFQSCACEVRTRALVAFHLSYGAAN